MERLSRLALHAFLFSAILMSAHAQSSEEAPKFQFLLGPVVGLGYVVDAQDSLDAELHEMFPDSERDYHPVFNRFGLNLEQRLRLGSSRSHFAFQQVFAVDGIDQGIFVPSFVFLLGFRSHRGLQFSLGPQFTVRWPPPNAPASSVIFAAGWSFPFFGAYVPVNLAFSPTSELGSPGFGLISGFDFEIIRRTGREVGTVRVTTVPPGAEVLLDGVPRGVSPVLVPDVPWGVVRLEGRQGAFHGAKQVRIRRAFTEVELVLAEQHGSLSITGGAEAAEVFLDGRALGRLKGGALREVPIGSHRLELKGRGLYWAGEVEVRRGEVTAVEVSPRAFGSLAYVLPHGVRAEIRGPSLDQTVEGMGTLEPLWVGTYTVATASDRYEPYSAELLVEQGVQITLNPQLEPTAEYEHELLSRRLEEAEQRLTGAAAAGAAEIEGLAALQQEILAARHEHLQLLAKSEVLLVEAKKQAQEAAGKVATLYVATTPPGAEVFLNGVSKGVSPLRIPDVPPGTVRVEAVRGEGRDRLLYAVEELQVSGGEVTLSLVLSAQAVSAQAGGSRFHDNGDGTILDRKTGLVWEKRPGGGSTGSGQQRWMEWKTASAYAENLQLAGFGDWRLPTDVELYELANLHPANPPAGLMRYGFVGIKEDFYWTATKNPGESHNNRWAVNLRDGYQHYQGGGNRYLVWAVRGGS